MLYRAIDKTDPEKNSAKMMGNYDPSETLSCFINQLKKGQEFAISGGQTFANSIMVSKSITLLSQTAAFNEDIREWRRKSTKLKTWEHFNIFSQSAPRAK